VEGKGSRKGRHKQLLDDFKKTSQYKKLKEKALYRTQWRTHLEEAVSLSQYTIRQHEMTEYHNRDGECLRRGTNWDFK
jgi:hypothetical protein